MTDNKQPSTENSPKPNPQPEAPITKDISLMKKGDYTVHLLIEEVKNLLPKHPDFLPKPVIKATCFNKTKRTSHVTDPCTEYTFNEHIYFEQTDLPYEVLDSSKVVIEVYDYNNSSREDYFGIYEFDFEYVYSSPQHSIKNLWITLANPESDNITQVKGYLKLSVSILEANDSRVELSPNPSADSECMVPPQIKVQYKQISIYLFKAEELPDMDSLIGEKKVNRECDGYVECKYMGLVKKTKVVAMKNEVIRWNEVIDLPVSQPAVSQKIVFTVKDENRVTTDAVIGSFELYVNDILADKYSELQTINIYGSAINDNSAISKLMNENAEIGSRWKGRVWLLIKHSSIDTPISGTRPIDDESLISQVYNTSRSNLWSVYVKIFEACYLPEDGAKYSMRVCIQENTQLFEAKPATNRMIKWNRFKALQCQTLTSSSFELPDIFIYLVDSKGRNVCFQRICSREFHLNDDMLMIKLIPEPCVNKVKEIYFSGIVKMKIKLFNKAIDTGYIDVSEFKDGDMYHQEDPDDLEAILNQPSQSDVQETKLKPHTIVANIFMTRYLIAGDSNGVSDAFTELRINQQKQQTSVKDSCSNGVWNESLFFGDVMMDINDKSTWPVMLLTVMDKDITSNDMLGYTYLWLTDQAYSINSTEPLKPRWQQLYLEKSNRPQGQILISFYIFDELNSTLCYHINIEPETIPYTVEINALGLRDLKPLSFIPVKKPYVSFDLNSINVSSRKDDVLAPIKTQPNNAGDNPNINAVIKFDVKLPKDEIFIPEMQCEVYDYILGGMVNQLLGVFMLSIKTLIRETHRTIEEDMRLTKLRIEERKNVNTTNVNAINANMNISQSTNTPLIPEDDNNKNDIKDIKIQINESNDNSLKQPLFKDETKIGNSDIMGGSNNNIPINDCGYICKDINDLNVIYTGAIDNENISQNKNNANYFVLKPSFTVYAIPGKTKQDKDYKEFLIENEEQAPSNVYYFPIGFNQFTNDIRIKRTNSKRSNNTISSTNQPERVNNKKHYRRIYGKELEKISELGLAAPFIKCRLVRGKYEDKADINSIYEALSNPQNKIAKRYSSTNNNNNNNNMYMSTTGLDYIETEKMHLQNMSMCFDIKQYGSFKGLVRVAEKAKMKEYNDFIEQVIQSNNGVIPRELHYLTHFDELSKNILTTRSVIVRVYLLELNNLAKRDAFSESDPYVIIRVSGVEKVNEHAHYMDEQRNCKWYKCYDILTELPGNSSLTIQVMDYDPIFADELIGETTVDIEDRYFDQKWRDLTHKPIETRQLYHPDYQSAQGEVLMWLEIFEKDEMMNTVPWNISPQPSNEMELRLIIWETENVECLDVEGTSDVYVVAYVDQKEKQSTDIHFRCQNGCASFNWRIVLPINIPRERYELIMQVYDNDILARDDFICSGKMNLYRFIRDCNVLDIPVVFTRAYQDGLSIAEKIKDIEFLDVNEDKDGTKFWVQMYKSGERKGRVLCSMEMVPKWKMEMNPVGLGRDEPNVDPYLPPPVGRLEFTLNPCKMINQLVGPKFRRKCYLACCMALCVLYLIIVIPYVIYHLGGELVNPYNYVKKASQSNNNNNNKK